MTDLNCLLAGLIRLFGPTVLLILWHKKTGARFYPALIAFGICFPAFIIGNIVRSGFDRENIIAAYIKQGILFGILEEGAKFLMLRFHLTNYDSRKDAVTYGIGHNMLENFGGGMACLGLIGTGRAAPEILWINLWTFAEDALWTAALTIFIFYGIRTDKSKLMLPLAMLIHAVCNAVGGIFQFSTLIVVVFQTLVTTGICFAAYRCWKAMENPYEDEF